MRHIKLIIPQAIRNTKKGKIDNNIIYKEAEMIIKKITPNIEVLFYKNKTLGIKCFNPVIANELFLNQEKIKEKINQIFKEQVIKKLIIKT